MSTLARGHLANTFGQGANFSLLTCIQREQTVCLAPITMTHHNGGCAKRTEARHYCKWSGVKASGSNSDTVIAFNSFPSPFAIKTIVSNPNSASTCLHPPHAEPPLFVTPSIPAKSFRTSETA